MKKLLLTLSSLGVVAGAATGVASCGTKKILRFDSENDHVIVLETGLADNHPGYRALNEIADEWNSGNSEYKLTVRRTEGGYDAQPGFYKQKLHAKDKKTLPNLWMGYADSAVIVNQYNMLLNMESDGMDQSIFNDQIIQTNDHMQNVEKGGLYLIPFAKSTETLIINKSLIGEVFWNANGLAWGNTKNSPDPDSPSTFTSEITGPKVIWDDIHATHNLTNNPAQIPEWLKNSILNLRTPKYDPSNPTTTRTLTAAATELSNFVKLNGDNIFSNWDLLVEFTKLMAKSLGISSDTNHHIMGVDSPSNMIMNMSKLYSLNSDEKTEQEKFFYNLDNQNKKLTWTSLTDKNHPENSYAPGKKAWDKILDSVNVGGLKMLGGGSFGSNEIKQKNLMMSLGSTAGTTYNMQTGLAHKFKVFEPGTPADLTSKIIGTEISHIGDCGDASNFEGISDLTNYLCSSDTNAQYILGSVKENTETKFPKYAFLKTNVTEGAVAHDSHTYDLFLPQPYEVSIPSGTGTTTIAGKHKLIYGQGPNLQAIHANAGEDEAVKKIVKWLFTAKFNWDKDSDTPEITSAKYFTQKSNYISGSKDIIKPETSPSGTKEIGSEKIIKDGIWKLGTNKYLVGPSIAWQSFNKLTLSPTTTEVFHYSVSDTGTSTGEFRSNIGDALRGLTSAHKSGQPLSTYSQFIHEQIKWAESLGYSL